MSAQFKEIQAVLISNSTQKTADFLHKLVPGKPKVYGVKTPVINEIVKKYKEGSFDLAEELWLAGAIEERIIAIKIMEKKGKEDVNRLFRLFNKFSKQLDNWPVCDGMGMQFLRSVVKTHSDRVFSIAEKLTHSKDPWQRRLSIVMVEWYTRDKTYHARVKHLISILKNDKEYYVQKAIKWISNNFKKGK